MTTFFEAIQNRQAYVDLSAEAVVPKERIIEVIEHAIKYVPTPFNSQSSRVWLITGERHEQFWTHVKQLETISEEERKQVYQYEKGYGTVLFFEDYAAISEAQRKNPKYLEYFPTWSNQSSGMLQFTVWNALQVEGFGGNLTHYEAWTTESEKGKWSIPATWELKAQLPFGKPNGEALNKVEIDMEKQFKSFGS
ncbi:nitroreductase family protein [Shouchella sp. JSM 1781072]|uniref:nitroreductase family protein n=1 Tax=Shouchella sp. JSM 1781072 TaxID=3344581 RepID=UPI0035BF53FF